MVLHQGDQTQVGQRRVEQPTLDDREHHPSWPPIVHGAGGPDSSADVVQIVPFRGTSLSGAAIAEAGARATANSAAETAARMRTLIAPWTHTHRCTPPGRHRARAVARAMASPLPARAAQPPWLCTSDAPRPRRHNAREQPPAPRNGTPRRTRTWHLDVGLAARYGGDRRQARDELWLGIAAAPRRCSGAVTLVQGLVSGDPADKEDGCLVCARLARGWVASGVMPSGSTTTCRAPTQEARAPINTCESEGPASPKPAR
jgi:hypothetical protein